MKVLCFGRFYDEIPGGMQRHVEHLFHGLRDRVDFVHLVPSRNRHGGTQLLHGFPVVRTPSLNVDGSIALSPTLALQAWRLHRQHRFDLIHLHFPDPMSHLAALTLPSTVPRVISWHADIVRHTTLNRFYGPLLRRAVSGAAKIIAATQSHVRTSPVLSALGDDPRINVIPYGFDLTRFIDPHPRTAEIRGRYPGPRVLAVGRHVAYKGFDQLIRAVPLMRSPAHLIIAGTGPLTREWQSLASRLGIESRVHFAGLVDDADLPAYYQAADLFCMPSVTPAEAFGIVQVEAMAAGRAVVATRLGNGADEVGLDGQTGVYVPPSNPQALASALDTMISDPAGTARMEAQARKRALAEFSIERMADRTWEVYREALARH